MPHKVYRMVYLPVALTLALSVMAPSAHAADDKKIKIAVMNIEATGISEEHVPILSEVLTTELHALARFEVISGRDIAALLGYESQKMAIYACDETSCLAELGAAIGAEKLLSSQIGRVGDTYIVNLKLIDVKGMRTERRAKETVEGKIDDVIVALRAAVKGLFVRSDTEMRAAGITSGFISQRAVATGFLLVGLAGGGVGAGFGVSAKKHLTNAEDPTFIGAQHEVIAGKRSMLLANVGYGVGGAFLLTGALLWLLDDTEEARQVYAVLPNVTSRSVGAAFLFSF